MREQETCAIMDGASGSSEPPVPPRFMRPASIIDRVRRSAPPVRGRRRTAWTALGFVVGAIALWLSARGTDRAGLAHAFGGVGWWWVAVAAVANVGTVVAQSWAWRIGLVAGGVGDIPLRHAVSATWIGKAGNQLLPAKIGELARIGVIRRHAPRYPGMVPRIVGSLVAQRVLASAATFATIVAAALWLPVPVDIPGDRWGPLGAFGAASLIVWLSWRSGIARRARHLVPRRLRGTADALAAGSALLRPTAATFRALILHGAALGFQLITMEMLLRAFDIAAPPTAPVIIVALVAVAGALPSPGGLGVNQIAIVAPLGTSYGVPASSALAFALGMQATVALVAVSGGLIALLHQRLARVAPGRAVVANA